MKRGNVAWLLSLPLSAAGMLLAHEFAWEFVPHEHEAQAGHGYLQYGAVFLALAAATVVVAATAQLLRGVAGRDVAGAPPAVVFAIVPIVGFLLQEHLEHLVVARELELSFFLSTPFVLGLALQLPFAFAALLVARLILGLVESVARAVNALERYPELTSLLIPLPLVVEAPRRRVLATRRAGRAPPRLS